MTSRAKHRAAWIGGSLITGYLAWRWYKTRQANANVSTATAGDYGSVGQPTLGGLSGGGGSDLNVQSVGDYILSRMQEIPPNTNLAGAGSAATTGGAGAAGAGGSVQPGGSALIPDPNAFYAGLGMVKDAAGHWLLPGESSAQQSGGAPSFGKFTGGMWDPSQTGTGQWVLSPGAVAPAGVDPSKILQLKAGQGAKQVNGVMVAYDEG